MRQPQLLDDGAHVLVTILPQGAQTQDDSDIVAVSIPGGERRVLVHSGTDGHLLPGGQLVYIHDATLLAIAVDMKRLEPRGGPVSVVEGVDETNVSGAGQFAIADNGTLVYVPGSSLGGQRTLVWVDWQGHEEPIPAKPRAYKYPRLSPDGKQIVVDSVDEENDIWVWDLARESLSRLTFGPAVDSYPVWTRDGRQIVYETSDSDRSGAILRRAADGTGAAEPLVKGGVNPHPLALSPDGKLLVYGDVGSATGTDLMVVPLDPLGAAKPLLNSPFEERNGDVSPDGRWIAYTSNESGGVTNVFVRPFPAVDTGKWQVITAGGSVPAWSRKRPGVVLCLGASRRPASARGHSNTGDSCRRQLHLRQAGSALLAGHLLQQRGPHVRRLARRPAFPDAQVGHGHRAPSQSHRRVKLGGRAARSRDREVDAPISLNRPSPAGPCQRQGGAARPPWRDRDVTRLISQDLQWFTGIDARDAGAAKRLNLPRLSQSKLPLLRAFDLPAPPQGRLGELCPTRRSMRPRIATRTLALSSAC